MAAVSIPPSPHAIGSMASRRVPLSNVPNAANSPFRAVAAAASKRARSQANVPEEIPYDEPPPAKKQIVEVERSVPRTPPPRKQPQPTEGRVLNRRPIDTQLSAFDRKLLAVKDRTVHGRGARIERNGDEPLDTLRQWQNHYRKVFPSFVFYFESVPEDARRQCSRHLHAFGAREEKFFSRDVTHVVTTRSPPIESGASTSTETGAPSSLTSTAQENTHLRTINPSLLEKSTDFPSKIQNGSLRGKFTFEAPSSKRPQNPDFQDVDLRKHAGSVDILQKAREMGIKIWQLEKFSRILHVMSEVPDSETQSQHGHNTRGNTVAATKTGRQADLSQMLRNEQINGPADREVALSTIDLVRFTGPYIYIRDMDEKTKPIMVREYAKVQNRDEGAWPQFRSVPRGKCPFIEDVMPSKRDTDKEKAKDEEEKPAPKEHAKGSAHPRTRAVVAATESIKMQPPVFQMSRKRPLVETEGSTNVPRNPAQQLPAVVSRGSSVENMQALQKNQKHHFPGIRPGFHGGEPMASGIQASNITSAIRSQMISSTAAAPGAKAGTSREIHGLQRKVLERNAGPSIGTSGNLQNVLDAASAAGSARNVAPSRAAKQKAQEKLVRTKLTHIEEDATRSEQEEADSRAALKQCNGLKALRGEPKELKPGYCENCREKFDDFDEHILGRKHRKFAINKDNWKELDALLGELVRPHRDDADEKPAALLPPASHGR